MDQTLREQAMELYTRELVSRRKIAARLGIDSGTLKEWYREDRWKRQRDCAQLQRRIENNELPWLDRAKELFVENGKRPEEIARELEIPEAYLRKICAILKWRNARSCRPLPEEATRMLRETDMSLAEIAQKLGMTKGALIYRIRRLGLPRRITDKANVSLEIYRRDNLREIEALKKEYIEGNCRLRQLCKANSLISNKVHAIAVNEDWLQQRIDYHRQHGIPYPIRSQHAGTEKEQARVAYVTGRNTIADLSHIMSIPEETLWSWYKKEHWNAEREAYRKQLAENIRAPKPADSAENADPAATILARFKLPCCRDAAMEKAMFAYITGKMSGTQAANACNVPISSFLTLIRDHGLADIRRKYADLSHTFTMGECLRRDTDLLTRAQACAEMSMDGMESSIGEMLENRSLPTEWGDVADAILKFVRLNYAVRGELDPEARARHTAAMARIDLLKERSQKEKEDTVIRVEWADGIEELAK